MPAKKHMPSPAMAVAMLALFIALGGTGVAATQLSRDSVGKRQIRTGAVTTSELRNSAVTGAKVANGSLTGVDIDVARLGKVPAAVDADRVNGRAVGCPAGTVAAVAACLEAATRAPLTLPAAIAACAAAGGRLPTIAELLGGRSIGVSLANPELTADVAGSTTTNPATLVQRVLHADGVTVLAEDTTNARRFRCVHPVVR
jgi:hypothetical protein